MAFDHPYLITTFTANKLFAGTDANVFIILFGSSGESHKISLKYGNNKDPFEKGQIDKFNVKTKDLGFIYQVKIFHDNRGKTPAWYLNKVEVTDMKTEKEYTFPCGSWLAAEGNYSTEALLEMDNIPVMKIDLLKERNHREHHSEKYKSPGLFIRKGQHFYLDIYCARDFNKKKDKFSLVLTLGNLPRTSNKTLVEIPRLTCPDDNSGSRWGYTILSHRGKIVQLEIVCPPDVLVGRYKLALEANDVEVYKQDEPIYILFNAWCPYDEVFMKNEEQRKEYITREHGCIFVGTSKSQSERKWFYGQFEAITVKCLFDKLEMIKPSQKSNAVLIARKLSGLVNSNDDKGLLVGNWTGKYDDGKAPTFWASSPSVLEVYEKESASVKYGQCWVFSGLVTTIMRCLGIPCRSVTNFNSAHDTEKNASFDLYIDENGEKVDGITRDSVWNFHCWNDVWMERPDLPPGYGGWQAIDATPQELSRGLYQMGPASLRAIKEGEVGLPYDTQFVLAEVNSDVIIWKKAKKTGEWEAIDNQRTHIGQKMSTKAINRHRRHDITEDYKFKEASVLERAAVKRALAKAGNVSLKSIPQEIEMTLDVPDIVDVGEDIVAMVKLINTGSQRRKVEVVADTQIVRYNGITRKRLDPVRKEMVLDEGAENKLEFRTKARIYMQYLDEHSSVRTFVTFQVVETGQVGNSSDVVDIKKPTLTFEGLPKEMTNGNNLRGYVVMTNPLDVTLSNCEVTLDGSLWQERVTIQAYSNTIGPNEIYKFPVNFLVQGRQGSRSIVASFTSNQLSGIYGVIKVRIVQRNPFKPLY